MSNLLIKDVNQVASPGAVRVYKEGSVNDGTLFCIEFSNKAATIGGDLTRPITDLADDTPVRQGVGGIPIETDPIIKQSPTNPIILTEDYGFPMTYVGNEQLVYDRGVLIHGLGNYLHEKQPKSVFIFWVGFGQVGENQTATRGLKLGQTGGATSPYMVSVNFPSASGSHSVSLLAAGKSGTGVITIPGQSGQVAVEYTGPTTPNKWYLNGVYQGEGSSASGGFGEIEGDGVLAIGGNFPNEYEFGSNAIIYKAVGHDLDFSGLTAEQVVKKDYELVNGLGEYAGIEGVRRAYANVPAA